jgi:hypothetical protein
MTYLETLGKLQAQTLEAVKQVQATQLAALTTIGELVSNVPPFRTPESAGSLPTFAELAEQNAAFVRSMIEQQNAYASQLAGMFTATQKNVVEAAERVVQTAANTATVAAK